MKYCMGCMSKIEDNRWNCPICGFDEKKYRPEPACLPVGTILKGKYIVGKSLKITEDTIIYIGLDAEQGKKIKIEEFFPRRYTYRDPGETKIGIYAGEAVNLFEKRLEGFIGSADNYIRENNTGYKLSEYNDNKTVIEIPTVKKTFLKMVLLLACVILIVGISLFVFIIPKGDSGVVPSATPIATESVSPTETPVASGNTNNPVTVAPEKTEKPKKTEKPTEKPKKTEKPRKTEKPTEKPEKTENPELIA